VLVVLSATPSAGGSTSFEEAAAALAAGDVTFYAVHAGAREGAPGTLDRLAATASGQALSGEDPAELVGLLDVVARDVANSYDLSYTSRATGPTWVTITVDHDGTAAEATIALRLPEPATERDGVPPAVPGRISEPPGAGSPSPERPAGAERPDTGLPADGTATGAARAPDATPAAPGMPAAAVWLVGGIVVALAAWTAMRRRPRPAHPGYGPPVPSRPLPVLERVPGPVEPPANGERSEPPAASIEWHRRPAPPRPAPPAAGPPPDPPLFTPLTPSPTEEGLSEEAAALGRALVGEVVLDAQILGRGQARARSTT